ncbi:NAD-dependent DNA ligase LigA [Candidatus Microgenomates bacterium]|nr:NAD-dependent DNA ligase LigA [Candidatus Microgenomates bacterium]
MTKVPQSAAERVTKLREQIDELRYRYHVLNDPRVSDEVYTSLTHELTELEAQYPQLVTPDSPTQRVGSKVSTRFVAVPHQLPMLSMNDVFDEAELRAWNDRVTKLLPVGIQIEYHVDFKMDGLAAAVTYENGVLVRGLTRGDGYIGEDVTANLKTIDSIPLRLRRDPKVPAPFYAGRVEVRGEVIIHKDDFAKINEERAAAGQAEYANPRNLAAGSVRQLDPRLTAARRLRFRAYSLVDPALPSLNQEYETASRLGFAINREHQVVQSIDQVATLVRDWESKRHGLPFQTDGLVVAVNDRSLFRQLGVAGKAPRGFVAYKYPPEEVTTKLIDILVSIGRTGAATPFAVLAPVVVAGSTVGLATLHNEAEVKRKDVRIGDTVIVRKAGDVIPEIVGPLPKLRIGQEKRFTMPVRCPVCGTKLTKQQAEEVVWRCPNKLCPSRVSGQLIHYASKGALDIEGLGEKNVQALLKAGLVEDIADLYLVTRSHLVTLERFAEVSAQKLVDAISARKAPRLDRFLYGLGIRHVGSQTAIDLARHFGSLDKIRQASMEEFETVAGIGQVVAHSIYSWFNESANRQLLAKLTEVGVRPEPLQIGTKLAGKAFVITGTLKTMSRDEAAEKIRAAGGKFQNAVGKDTDYLVVGEDPGGSKVADAQKYRTEQISESRLRTLLE